MHEQEPRTMTTEEILAELSAHALDMSDEYRSRRWRLTQEFETRQDEPESVHDLFRKVREHPDFVFGTIFVRDDVPSAFLDRPENVKYAEEHIVTAGFEYIEDATP